MIRKCAYLAFLFVFLLGLSSSTLLAKLSSSEFSKAKRQLLISLQKGEDPREAVSELASDNSARAVDVLLKVAVANIPTKSYYAVLNGLATMNSEEAVKAMAKKLKNGKWPQKVIVATVFGAFNDPASAKALVDALDDKYQPVVRTVIKAIARRKVKDAIEPLIKLIRKNERNQDVLWLDARQGLTSITGEDFLKAELWEKWWSINKSTFDPHAKKGDKKTATVEKKGPRFFTEQIVSKRLIFIIDISGSMTAEDPPSEKGGGGVRIKRAKNELINVIKNLSQKVKFNIIAYSDTIKPWQKGRLVYATRGSKYAAIKYVEKLKAVGLTRTDKAFDEAFRSLEANTFYLLTDGAPTKANKQKMQAVLIPPNEILEQVRKLNRFRKIKIFTMGFAEETKKPPLGPVLVEFLQVIAKENDGRFSPIH